MAEHQKIKDLGKHMTLDQRLLIQEGIVKGKTKKEIALDTGKDQSTISKEIKRNGSWVAPTSTTLKVQCANYKECKVLKKNKKCPSSCEDFVQFECKRRDRSPGACNGCDSMRSCRFLKFKYNAKAAENKYRTNLVDSRVGADITEEEAIERGKLLKDLLDKGQSIYMILQNNPEFDCCEKTLYNHINERVYAQSGVTNSSLRKKTSRRSMSTKTAAKYKKRKDSKYLKNREYEDYLEYMNTNEENGNHISVVEMDTVYNDVSNGPFIQTFKFMDLHLLFALLHTEKTAKAMVKGVDELERILGEDVFKSRVQVLLTDRGSEFVKADEFEANNRTKIFYCDPMASGQKGSLENNHIELRYILPKEKDLRELGLKTQTDLNTVLSHVNSFPKKLLGGATPLELTKLIGNDVYDKLKAFGVIEIEPNEVTLTEKLLRNKK